MKSTPSPQAEHTYRSRTGLLLVGLATMLAACTSALSGSSIVIDPPPDRDVTETVDVFDLQIGDCGFPPSYLIGEVTQIDLVPCDEPHTQEVIYITEAPFDNYPGASKLVEFGREICARAVVEGLGIALEDQFVTFLNPTATSWREGDRDIVCVLWWPDVAPMTGSWARGTQASD